MHTAVRVGTGLQFVKQKFYIEKSADSENNHTDYMSCNAAFGKSAFFTELTPTTYTGCRAPTVKLGPLSAALGTGCYCKEKLYEYTSDKAYCLPSYDKCKCATTVQRYNEWYLVETTVRSTVKNLRQCGKKPLVLFSKLS